MIKRSSVLTKPICIILLMIQVSWVTSADSSQIGSNDGTSQMGSKSTSGISALGGLYRSARDGFRSSRLGESNCLRCGYDDNRDGRFFDDYLRRDPVRSGYDDRNWYYQSERNNNYDDRSKIDDRYTGGYMSRYGDERDRYLNRYDNRYDSRPNSYYDRYNTRGNLESRYSGYDTRGNGYDNRNPYYNDNSRDRYNDRSTGYYPTTGYYPSEKDYTGYYNDRYNSQSGRGTYDYRTFHPWDETYRGVSGFDDTGRGHYFASQSSIPLRPYSPLPPYSSSQSPTYSSTQYYQKPHRPIPFSPSHVSSSLLPDGYQNRDENNNGNDNGNHISGNSQQSNNVGYAGSWGYVNSNDKHVPNRDKDRDYNMNSNIANIPNNSNNNNNNKNQNVDRDRNNEEHGNYASRPVRPALGNMSYLHDRDTPLPKPGSQTMAQQSNNNLLKGDHNEKITSGLTIEVKSPDMKNNS